MVKPYFDRPSGKVQQDINMFSGGLNTYIEKSFIGDTQVPFAVNMGMWQPPVMSTRPTRDDMGLFEYVGYDNGDYNIGVESMYAVGENDIYVLATSDEWEGDNPVHVIHFWGSGDNWGHEDLGTIPEASNYYFCHVKAPEYEYLYITSPEFKYKIIIEEQEAEPDPEPDPVVIDDENFSDEDTSESNENTSEEDSSSEPNPEADEPNFDFMFLSATPNPQVDSLTSGQTMVEMTDNYYGIPAWHKGRLFLANPSTNIISFSAYMEPDTFNLQPSDTERITGDFYVTNSKGVITGIKSFDDKLVIFCEHSMHLLYGDTPDQTFSTQFQLVDMDNDLGAISPTCIDTGGGRLFWLGDNYQIYEYTGSAIYMISRPTGEGEGGIDNLLPKDYSTVRENVKFVATYDKLFINMPVQTNSSSAKYLFVYDIYNKVWWCEDGDFVSITELNSAMNILLLATETGHIFRTLTSYNGGADKVYTSTGLTEVPIKYMFQTKTYGTTSVSGAKSIGEVWLQARAEADVYLCDVWTSIDLWYYSSSDTTLPITNIDDIKIEDFKKIGTLTYEYQYPQENSKIYAPQTYERQAFYVEKMFGQRLNAFSLIVKGEGQAEFYLMQRKWRINENI